MTITVGITPADEQLRYRTLLEALEEAYPVRFVGVDGVGAEVAALVVLPGGHAPDAPPVPCLVLETPDPAATSAGPFIVQLSRSNQLDRALLGQKLLEQEHPRPGGIRGSTRDDVLASVARKVVWSSSPREGGVWREHACVALVELADGDYLRDHLTAGRFWSLLPLAHFLKRLTIDPVRRPRPNAACLVIDDPNVRLPSYGYVQFSLLGRDAREHGYHVAVATIPLDLMVPGRRGLKAFREHPRELSLVVHGSDHLHRELERYRDTVEAERIIRTAEVRVRRFEEQAGFRIERVMCPPHGRCGPATIAALFRWNYDGLAAAQPFPWEGFADQRDWRLGGWLPAQLAGGGLPVLPRHPLGASLDDLVFRAFLEQPLIVYGHHTDLRDGVAPFHRVVERVAQLGEPRWMSLGSIARTNALVDVAPAVTTVEIYSRDVHVSRPAGDSLRIVIPRIFGGGQATQLAVDGRPIDVSLASSGKISVDVPHRSDESGARIRLDVPSPPTVERMHGRLPRPWAIARRAMTEGRDRALPRVYRRRA